ncbi:hypothetical protein SCA04_12170 [Staphylococcus carnosus]|nr:hypothetical protein SCA04_12170 [Staphylococcus carnosus]
MLYSLSLILSIRFPLKLISPWSIRAIFSGNNCITDKLKTDFPDPDSPTIPRISPFFTDRLILFTVENQSFFYVEAGS